MVNFLQGVFDMLLLLRNQIQAKKDIEFDKSAVFDLLQGIKGLTSEIEKLLITKQK